MNFFSIFDMISNSFQWRSVRRELIETTNYICKKIVPEINILLQTYIYCFHIDVTRIYYEQHPGWVEAIIIGKFIPQLNSIVYLLERAHSDFEFDISYRTYEVTEASCYKIICFSPEGYRFSVEEEDEI